MGYLHRPVSVPSIRALLWVAGLAALLGAIVGWVLPAQPYQAPWAWISFIGMCVLDDVLFGSREGARWGELPKLTLLAAIIVFRRHPELTVLVAATAAPLGSLLKGQTWSAELTSTAQWILAAVLGAITFRVVGFADAAHFVAATAALMVVYSALGPILSAALAASLTQTRFWSSFAKRGWLAIWMLIPGALLALAWRTPSLEPAALKVADGTLVTVAGILGGFLLGGRASRIFGRGTPIPTRPLVVAGTLLLISEVAPAPLAWLLPLGLATVAGIWGARRGLYPVACGALGALCNETVRGVNGGHMPVDGQGMLVALGDRAGTYVVAGPQTNLAWLDDRFSLPPPFPGIASAGDILIAIGMAWFVATLMLRRPLEVAVDDAGEDLAAA